MSGSKVERFSRRHFFGRALPAFGATLVASACGVEAARPEPQQPEEVSEASVVDRAQNRVIADIVYAASGARISRLTTKQQLEDGQMAIQEGVDEWSRNFWADAYKIREESKSNST